MKGRASGHLPLLAVECGLVLGRHASLEEGMKEARDVLSLSGVQKSHCFCAHLLEDKAA